MDLAAHSELHSPTKQNRTHPPSCLFCLMDLAQPLCQKVLLVSASTVRRWTAKAWGLRKWPMSHGGKCWS